MAGRTLKALLTAAPVVHDAERAAAGWETWAESLAEDASGLRKVRALKRHPKAFALFNGLFSTSPYLTRLVRRFPLAALAFTEGAPDVSLDRLMASLRANFATPLTTADAKRALRQTKAQVHLLTALADLGGVWPLERVTGALTRLADGCLAVSIRHLFTEALERGEIVPRGGAAPELGAGLAVIAMGKYGAGELNYSSDIDICVYFDADTFPARDEAEAKAVAVRMTRGLVSLMQDTTEDGYVFRTDLRLRPDPGATALALSMDAAELYYETMGQNWERAALIKARACAGDRVAGAAFLARLKPFIWRRYLDYTALQDIHAIKRQIHAHKGFTEIDVAGHNVKLGMGGIREIEFFVQTQQLIMGGRDHALRIMTTIGGLQALAGRGLVEGETAESLAGAYRFLRQLEHRLQMIEDAQTHTLPEDEEGLLRVARLMGMQSLADFKAQTERTLRDVNRHYAELFDEETGEAPEILGNLVFTGVEDDPATLETLVGLGFEEPQRVSEIIRGWHRGHIRATRTERARALLTRLIPPFLTAIARTGNADLAFAQFDRFLSALPGGVQ
ncbi:MAG: bifunctional [glutamine synthetase] adenylyltransferase/[glutamine synthetase]-adenylyl-L-tyrosine phosphorylase, partial [Pseudomonadota bacterium]